MSFIALKFEFAISNKPLGRQLEYHSTIGLIPSLSLIITIDEILSELDEEKLC